MYCTLFDTATQQLYILLKGRNANKRTLVLDIHFDLLSRWFLTIGGIPIKIVLWFMEPGGNGESFL